jgi:hypothetical protein
MKGRTPTHRCTLHLAGGEAAWMGETKPLHKLKPFRGYCKYCCATRANWWLMRWQDYFDEPLPDDRMLLCGRCQHTSLESNVVLEPIG